MSQQQQEQIEQVQRRVEGADDAVTSPAAEAQAVEEQRDGQPATGTPDRKRKQRKWKWVNAEDVTPRPSYWPIGLALSLCVLLIGVAIHPIVMGIGLILVVAMVIGWIVERR